MDGHVYDQVPFYVVDWCDEVVKKAKAACTNPIQEESPQGLPNETVAIIDDTVIGKADDAYGETTNMVAASKEDENNPKT